MHYNRQSLDPKRRLLRPSDPIVERFESKPKRFVIPKNEAAGTFAMRYAFWRFYLCLGD